MLHPSAVADIRKEYTLAGLSMADTAADPVTQFERWFADALRAQVNEPNAMHLATVSSEGRPSGRIVLVKDISSAGFAFYTNYESRKGRELAANAWVSLTFFWPELERQVRIEGRAQPVPAEQSDAYFHSRPRGSQIGAWASPQSRPIDDRHVLEQNQQRLQQQYGAEQPIPRPPHWGGYCVTPDSVEFWQGRASRLHDRIVYVKDSANQWQKQRLAP